MIERGAIMQKGESEEALRLIREIIPRIDEALSSCRQATGSVTTAEGQIRNSLRFFRMPRNRSLAQSAGSTVSGAKYYLATSVRSLEQARNLLMQIK